MNEITMATDTHHPCASYKLNTLHSTVHIALCSMHMDMDPFVQKSNTGDREMNGSNEHWLCNMTEH